MIKRALTIMIITVYIWPNYLRIDAIVLFWYDGGYEDMK
jgi:hypothetical protein